MSGSRILREAGIDPSEIIKRNRKKGIKEANVSPPNPNIEKDGKPKKAEIIEEGSGKVLRRGDR